MFEQEIEMEKHQSSAVPLLLIVCLIIAVVGVAGYYAIESRKVLGTAEAANVAIDILKAQGPATVSFHTGLVVPSVADRPRDVHYRLLEKAGVLKLGKDKGNAVPVTLTAKGEALLKQIPGVKNSLDKGVQVYVVPLAERRLLEVSNIKMTGTGRATVEYVWRWEPNSLGEIFDASGPTVKTFNTWERASLIQKHGANFYHEAPTKVVMAVMKNDKGVWQVVTEY